MLIKSVFLKSCVFGLLLVGFSTSASAAFYCRADVKNVLIYKSGAVNIKHSGRNHWTYICSLKGEWKGVSVSTCAMWTATLQRAKKDAQKMLFYYSSSSEYSSCAELPIYGGAPSPIYIGDN